MGLLPFSMDPNQPTNQPTSTMSSPAPSPTKIASFRQQFESSLSDIAHRTDPTKRCLILSGGVDTCAILEASVQLGIPFQCSVTVVVEDPVTTCPDREFAVAAARKHGLKHYVVSVTVQDLLDTYLPQCVKLLECFDGMTLRNSLVIAAAFEKVKELGYQQVVVGDGADELMGGYSFTWGHADDPALWKDKRDKMCAKWTFATKKLAEYFGLEQYSPYMEPAFVEWVTTNVLREDCIGHEPIRLVHEGEAIPHAVGKIILRRAYETVSSWRRKDPIEVGSGITVIGKDPYWTNIISDDQFSKEVELLKAQGFIIKNKEHLINYRAFARVFGFDGSKHPTAKRLSLGQGCAGCCFEIGDATFCRICGAWPAQRKPTTTETDK